MTRALKAFVHLNDADSVTHVFRPGDVPPAWAAERITNPNAWADEPAAIELVENHQPPTAPSQHTEPAGPGDAPPPKAGNGSGLDAWLEYAGKLGITVPDGATRGDVIELVENHQPPTGD